MNYKHGDTVKIKGNGNSILHSFAIGQIVEIITTKENSCYCMSKPPYMNRGYTINQNVSFPDIEPITENIDDYSIF